MHLLLQLYCYMQLHLIVLFSVQDLYPWQWHMELVIQLFILSQYHPCMGDVSLLHYFNPLVIGKSRFMMHYVIRPVGMSMHLGFHGCRGKD